MLLLNLAYQSNANLPQPAAYVVGFRNATATYTFQIVPFPGGPVPGAIMLVLWVLHAGSAGYYQWLGRADCPASGWEWAAIAFSRHARRYGTRRLRAEPRAEGYVIGRYALHTWLRRRGFRALSPRPPRPRTTVPPVAIVAENLLLGQPASTVPKQVWGP